MSVVNLKDSPRYGQHYFTLGIQNGMRPCDFAPLNLRQESMRFRKSKFRPLVGCDVRWPPVAMFSAGSSHINHDSTTTLIALQR